MTARVLHVTPTLEASAGGPPVVVERLAGHAAEHGYASAILTSGAGAAREGVTVLPSQRAAMGGAGRHCVAEAVRGADIVHLHTMWSPLNAAAARAARAAGIPYVMAPHGMLDPWSMGQKALKKRLYWRLVERGVANSAARLVYTSAAERDLAGQSVGPSAPAAVIPLGADAPPEPRAALRAAFFAEHPDLEGRPLVLFLGRLHPKKRPEALIAAAPRIAAALPEARILLVGPGEGGMQSALAAQARAAGVAETIRLLGPRTGARKWQALAAADVFVLPSQQENFAIAVAEALRTGVPVLLTRAVNIWQEVVEAGAGRALEERDLPGSIAAGVLDLLGDEALRAEMGRRAAELAAEAFTWAGCARRTCALYDEILDGA